MARAKTHAPLGVFLNSRLVGQLSRLPNGAIEFAYDRDWLAFENALPISLSLPLREDRYVGAPVIAVFDNLLPDGKALRRRVAERVGAEGDDPYSLLAAIGRDCVGAMQFLPEGETPGTAGTVSGRPVDGGYIARKLGDLARAPLGMDEDQSFRISLAGAQEKTALLFWKGRWHAPLGATPTTHIVKPQIGLLANGIDMSQSVENEFLCMKLATAFGLPTASVEMADFEGQRALVVERFDRLWTRDKRLLRLPQEDCCQALSVPPTLKYQADGGPGVGAILDLLKASDEPERDRALFLKAQIVFWLLGATDGHAKNFSVFLEPGGRFRLAPLYDILSAQPDYDAGRLSRNRMKLAMSVGDNRHYAVYGIVPRHFLQTAKANALAEAAARAAFDEILAIEKEAVSKVLNGLPAGFSEALAGSVAAGLNRRARLLESAQGDALHLGLQRLRPPLTRLRQ